MADPIDELLCPGADVESFEQHCRVQVTANAWNRWLLFVRREGQSNFQLQQQVRAVLLHVTTKYGGAVRGPVTMSFSESEWGSPVAVRGDLQCGQPVTLAEGDYHAVWTQFIWRGESGTVPWPSFVQRGPAVVVCPSGAANALEAAYAPSGANVPGVETDPLLPPAAQSLREIAESAIVEATGANQIERYVQIGMVIGGIIAVGYLVRSIR